VGVEDELLQEEVAALVVAETSVDGEALRVFVGGHLAGYKVPRYVFQVPSIPLTASGKPDQPKLKKMAEELISADKKNNKESNT
jgi:acyl-CoA synthetase (AMP-forming)/AMP-acid ligase II